ncbi:MAG: hypothetical protein K2X87_33440 [Gemmataceae bacterium]|nr:hypothetical protein [Gemmataceae bacterium]
MADEEKDTGPKLDKWQGLLIFLVAQTISGIWWAANVTSSLPMLKDKAVETTATIRAAAASRYTAQDANRDFTFRDEKFKENNDRPVETDRRMVELERRFARTVQ